MYLSVVIEKGLHRKAIVKFYIDTSGMVKTPIIVNDAVGGGCTEEALRLIAEIPKWTTDIQTGKAGKSILYIIGYI